MNLIKYIIFIATFINTIQADKIEDITKNIKSVCISPDQKSNYWEIKSEGDAKVNIKLLGIKSNLNGSLSTGEWEGIQRVLKKQQANENKNYRECVRELTPIFMNNFKNQTINNTKKAILIKDNKFSTNLTVYEEGDLANELGKDLVVNRINKKNVISGLQSNPSGYLEIKNLNLKNNFIVYIVNDPNTNKIEYILRTRDDDVDNDIKITFLNNNFIFGDTKKNINYKEEVNYNGGSKINEFKLYMKKDVVKFYINDKYFGSIKANNSLIYDKFIIKSLEPKDFIYEISGYNIVQ